MNGPSAWRGTDRWGRDNSRHMPLMAGEVASYRSSPRLGLIIAILSSAAFWVPVTIALLVWAGRR